MGSAEGGVKTVLRLEGVAMLAGSVWLYAWLGADWRLFAATVLAPDLSFAAYLAGARIGAAAYNAAHSTIGPIALALLAAASGHGVALALAIVWAAHIGFDRALGYGLKYQSGFGDTHLGRIGRVSHA